MNILITEKEFHEYRKLKQKQEELIKWLEDEDEILWATATEQIAKMISSGEIPKEIYNKYLSKSLIERRTTLRKILSKLKGE